MNGKNLKKKKKKLDFYKWELPCIHLCVIYEEMKQVFSPLPFYLLKQSKTQVEIFSWLSIIHFTKNHVNMEEAKR